LSDTELKLGLVLLGLFGSCGDGFHLVSYGVLVPHQTGICEAFVVHN